MKLQLLRPTLVFAGAWNPAVFQVGWVAKNVHGIPAGAEVRVDEVTVTEPGRPPKKINYIEDMGVFVSHMRLEIYPIAIDRDSSRATEQKVAKILELLPHTPLTGFGVNFTFEEENPSPDLQHKIRSDDGLSNIVPIFAEELTSRANIEPHVQLTLQRRSESSAVSFNFNYHHSVNDTATIRSELSGAIERRLEQSIAILKQCYDLSEYEVSKPEFSEGTDSDHA